MKHTIIGYLSLVLLLTACHQKENTQLQNSNTQQENLVSFGPDFTGGARAANRLFPDKLRNLPNEINATHYPNPCYAVLEDSMYIWKHDISIQVNEDLQIVEYGSFVYTDEGWYLRITMNAQDFEASYNCKGGLLKKGIVYTDHESWRRDKTLRGGDALWYFIAKDKNGRLVKGMAPIETEGKLVNSTVKTIKISRSDISWTGYGEIGNYSLTGNIKLKNAELSSSGDTLTKALVMFDMNSITHEEQNLVDHLKGEDFFEVSKYPTAVFETQSIAYTGQATAVAKGILKIKGVSKPISIPLEITTKGKEQTIHGKIAVDRTRFGIKYNSKSFFGNLGDQAIKNNFDLDFTMQIIL